MSPESLKRFEKHLLSGGHVLHNRSYRRLSWRHGARAVAILAVSSVSAVANGEDWFFQPAASVGFGYEENVNLTDDDPLNTTRYDLEALARGGRLTERSQIIGRLKASFRRYPGNELLNSDNISATLDSALLPTELNRLSLGLSLDRTTSRRSELTTTGNITENVPRYAMRVAPAWERRLSERSAAGVQYTHERVRFDSNISGLVDYQQDDIRGNYAFQVTERLGLQAAVGAVVYEPVDVEKYKGYDIALGFGYEFSETLMGSLEVGYQRIDSEIDSGAGSTTRTASGTVYNFSLSKQLERGNLTLSLGRSAVPTGSAEPLLQERLNLGYAYKVSPRLTVAIPVAVFRNETISFGDAEDQDERRLFLRIQPRVSWRVTEDLSLNASYRYQHQRFEKEGSSSDGNAVFLSLSYVWPTEVPGLAR